MAFLLSIWAMIFIFKLPQRGDCQDKQAFFHVKKQTYLANHVIATKQADSELECSIHCVADGSCVSVNFKTSGNSKGRCELNDKTLKGISDGDESTHNPEFNHLSVIFKNPPEPASSNIPSAVMQEPSVIQHPMYSCKELLQKNGSLGNGVYQLNYRDSPGKYQVYCQMTEIDGCEGKGWTLVMKMGGTKNDFSYNSTYWTNNDTHAVEDGLEGLTEKQTKLASYWNTPFNRMCLGMKVNGVTKWMDVEHQASSLFSQIADGRFRATSAGKDQWKSLIAGSYLQPNCNKEGFNFEKEWEHKYYIKTRIGFVANDQNDCITPDSCIGFGASIRGCGVTRVTSLTCGNLLVCRMYSSVAAFGFILVK